jgi:KRAB domain-containing zinc finger protein
MEVACEVAVEGRDFSPAPTEVAYYAIDPLDEESAESESEDDSSADYEDGEADSEDEWILNIPQPLPTPPAAPVDEVEELRKRWARASVRRRFRCEHEHCEKAFKTGSDLKRHMLIHAQVRQFGCEHCEKRFTRRQDLKRHLVTHLVAPAPRSASSPVGDDQQLVETSIAVVASASAPPPPPVIVDEATGQRRFGCTYPGCDKTFTLNQNLKRHRKVIHKDTTTTTSSSSSSEEERQAATISTTTSSSSGVVVIDEATGQQRFACTYPGCGQTYSHRPNLTRHRKSAHKDTTASATSSSSSSSSSSGEDEHPRPPSPATSTGVIVQDEATGRFVCDFVGCDKTFTLRNNLARHRRTHQGASYQCPECDKSYTQSGDLKRHLSIHSGERPFACHLCEQAFRQKAHLAAHLRSKAHASSLS